jgi:Fe-Mn family superoxide dismutase
MTTDFSRRNLLRTAGLGALALSLGAGTAREALAGLVPATAPYRLPPLPYAYDALAPEIGEPVLRVHHDKHHAGYVKGLNGTLALLQEARAAGDMARIQALSRSLAFHGSGHVLHSLYWTSMKPGGSPEPKGAFRAALDRDFGSLAALQTQFAAASRAVEGSGWGILAYEPLGRRLLALQCENHQNLTIWGCVPLLICDVWEHAYYLQYKSDRAAYVAAFMKLVHWPEVEARYAAAIK